MALIPIDTGMNPRRARSRHQSPFFSRTWRRLQRLQDSIVAEALLQIQYEKQW